MSSRPQHVVLVPGFFGFTHFGDVAYFGHVQTSLREQLAARGVRAEVSMMDTLPTASLRRRAAHLAEVLHRQIGEREVDLHLVGHSSGGLDIRLLLTPGVSLPTEVSLTPILARVRTAVLVASPNLGTPVAATFSSLLGGQLLRVFSLASGYAVRTGHVPLRVLLQLLRFLVRPSLGLGGRGASNALDQLYRDLLADFTKERRQAIESFFSSIGADQDLLPQLTPAAMDVFNAATPDRPEVRYGSVVIAANPPRLRSFVSVGLDSYAQVTHAVYAALHRLVGSGDQRFPRPSVPVAARLLETFGHELTPADNDGMVPTLSQLWGELIAAAPADHLDVIGHFDHPSHVPPHFDWLTSGTGFTRDRFEALWSEVAGFISGRDVSRDTPGTG